MLHQVLHLNSIQLAYREWPGGSEPLLLLHGMVDHGGVWENLAGFLNSGSSHDLYHILAPDLRGHGNSSKPDTGYRSTDIIADLAALMDQVGWASAHVIAHSWSAKIAAVWAQQEPQRFRSLILIDPFFINRIPRWLKTTFPILYRVLPFLKMMGPFDNYAKAEAQARQLKQYQGWSLFQQAVFRDSIEQKPDGTWGSKFVVPARDEIFADVMEVAGLTTSITIPTLFIQPKHGLNRTAWQLKPYRTHLQNLHMIQVPGHHWCFLVEPQAFNQAVSTFLSFAIASRSCKA